MSITFLNYFEDVALEDLDGYLVGKVFHTMLPDMLKIKMLREAAIEFCRDSEFWRDELTLWPAEGLAGYAIPMESGVQLVKLISAVQEGRTLDLDRDCRMINSAAVTLSEDVAKGGGQVVLTAALMPSITATTLSAGVAQYAGEWIAAGAAYRLLMMANQPWTDRQEAMVHKEEFEAGKRKARRAMLNRFTTYRNPSRRHTFY